MYCSADFGFDYAKMKVYQSEEAYETLRICPQTDLLVPLQYLPISAEAQAVIIVDFYNDDGYYFLTGYTKDDQPAMVQILPEE